MAGYDLLTDLVVLEVAQFGPDALGGYLADMGATVIKVEHPSGGDPVRSVGYKSVGEPDGEGYLHLRWNRGKRSLALDLQSDEGRRVFKRLAAKADIVIEGMRAGVLARLGLGYDTLRAGKERLVYCIVSGMGLTGPYAAMSSHGPAFDAFGGLGASGDGDPGLYGDRSPTPVGMHAVSLYAALGALSAVLRARRTGQGALIDVAAADCSAHWLPEHLDAALNSDVTHERAGFADQDGRMLRWPRLDNYRAADGLPLLLMAHSDKAWAQFCDVVERPDLKALYDDAPSIADADARCAPALTALFRTQPRESWLALFRRHNVPAIATYDFPEIPDDPHFAARDNIYAVEHPVAGPLRLTGTPVKLAGEAFSPTLAPALGADGADILHAMLDLSETEIAQLRASGVLG